MEGAPLTFGVLRPTVVLFPGLEGTELACVLAHEGVHARRRDNLWHYAAAAALTVFWWDPAVWLMARLIRRDVELSCDRAVVRRLGEGKRAEYANALVTLSTQAEGGAFCHGFGPKRTEERIIAVMKYKKTTIIGAALTLALVLAVTVGFASNPGADIPDREDITSFVPDGEDITSFMPDEEGTTPSSPTPYAWMCYSDSNAPNRKVLGGNINIDFFELLLANHVADGSMTEEDAAYYLAAAKARSQDGVYLNWIAPRDIELFSDEPEHRKIGHYVYYMNGNGNKVCLDPAEMLTAYIFAPNDADVSGSDADANYQDEICTREDCPLQPSVHFHEADGSVTYVYSQPSKYSEPETDNQGNEIVYCGFEDCTIQGEHFHHDPQLEDSAGDGSEPIGCPPEAIDQDFYQKYPKASEQNFEHHESGHHQDSHH